MCPVRAPEPYANLRAVSHKPHFRRALDADPERLHFAAHSHHLWPDASFDGQIQAWAEANLVDTRIEIGRAEVPELLKIPGIGPKGAAAIVAARRQARLRDIADLRRLGVPADRAAPYILINGRAPARQLSLFAAA